MNNAKKIPVETFILWLCNDRFRMSFSDFWSTSSFISAAVDIRKPGWRGGCWRGRELKALHFTVKSTYTLSYTYTAHNSLLHPIHLTFIHLSVWRAAWIVPDLQVCTPEATSRRAKFGFSDLSQTCLIVYSPPWRGKNGWIVETISILLLLLPPHSLKNSLLTFLKGICSLVLAGYNAL